MKINKEVILSMEDICNLYEKDKIAAGENVPGANCDYPDGWELDAEIEPTVEVWLDLVLYLNGKINLCKDANEMLGLKKENREKVLNELMEIYNESITSIYYDEYDKYLLCGNINNIMSAQLSYMKEKYKKCDKKIIENNKTL